MNILFRPQTLAKKIVSVIILTTLIAMVTVIFVVSLTLKKEMQHQRQRHLVGVKHLVEQLIEDNRRTVKNYAILFSSDRQIKDNLYYYAELAGERIHPLNAIKHMAATFDLQFIELGDRYGRVVANDLRPDQHDRDRSSNILIRSALAGKEVSGIEKYGDGFLLKAVAPIYHDESQLIGTISTGMLMNDDFAQVIKNLSGVEIFIIDQEARIIASTDDEHDSLKTLQPVAGTYTIGAKHYQVMQLPFEDSTGLPLGTVLIMAEDSMSPILRAANRNIILVLIVISLLSITATILIVRHVLRPVNELRQGAEKIGSGKFDHRIAVTSTDEIGNLAAVFNRMAANLQKMRDVEEKLKHSERLASIGEFTAATAHELNNPIANIIGLLKVMRRELSDNAPCVDDLDLVIKEANRCGAIVRDLLMYSRNSQPKKERTDLRLLIEEAIAGINKRYKRGKTITVSFAKPGDAVIAMVDPNQFAQVVRNILVNAFQAIAQQGEISVQLHRDDHNALLVTITDNGAGIPEDDLDKIFYPFFTTKKSGEGTGLGLAVCYTIMQSHNGDIRVKSKAGVGSTFTLVVPPEESDE